VLCEQRWLRRVPRLHGAVEALHLRSKLGLLSGGVRVPLRLAALACALLGSRLQDLEAAA
jgi:hypothetical protein